MQGSKSCIVIFEQALCREENVRMYGNKVNEYSGKIFLV